MPVAVKLQAGGTLTDAVQISSQDDTFCALRADTSAVCWGRGNSGQLGDGAATDLSLATQVWTGSQNLSGIRKVASGENFTCALMISGGVKCWGNDSNGQLGNGASGQSNLPVDALNIAGAIDIGAGSAHACVLLGDGTVKCWGRDLDGEQGNGSASSTDQITPGVVPDIAGARQLGVGFKTNCAQVADGSLKCWGDGIDGEFTEASKVDHPSPVTIPGISGFIALTSNFESTPCVLNRGGGAVCWGKDGDNQIGVPPNSGSALLAPTQIAPDLVTLSYPGSNTTVTQAAKTKLDKKKKTYTLSVKLTTTPNLLVAPAEACTGPTGANTSYSYSTYKKVKGKKKKKKVKKTKRIKKAGTYVLTGNDCTSTIALKLPVKYFNGKKAKVGFNTAGNGSL